MARPIDDRNYWEQGGNVNPAFIKPNAPAPGAPSIEAILAAAIAQQQAQTAQAGGNPIGNNPVPADNMGFVGPMFNTVQRQQSGDMPDYDVSSGSFLNPRVRQQGFQSGPAAPVAKPSTSGGGKLGAGLSKGVGGFMDIINAVAQSIVAKANEPKQDPESVWDRILGSTPKYEYGGPSGEQMASQEFAPQFEILKQLGQTQKGNYDSGSAKLKGMFDSLVNDTRQSTDKINQNYAAATQQINQNGAQAAGNVTQNVQTSGANINEELARLGQMEAMPALDDKRNAALAQQLGHLASGQQNSANTMTSLGANAYAYGQERGDIQKQSGVLRQADFLQEFINAQNENEYARLGLTGQQGAQANKYNLSIADMNRQGHDDWLGTVNDRTQGVTDFNQSQIENEMRQAGLDLDVAKLRQSSQPKPEAMNAYDKLQQSALGTYGGDPASASTISNEILNVWKQNPNATPAELMNSLNEDVLRSNPEIAALAFAFFQSVGIKGR